MQLIISDSNVFYHPNLERDLSSLLPASSKPVADYDFKDNIIGTKHFLPNQYDLNFIWQRMEEYSQSLTSSPTDAETAVPKEETPVVLAPRDGGKFIRENPTVEDISTKNFQYFSQKSGIDFKSSSQLIFDVLMEIIEVCIRGKTMEAVDLYLKCWTF